MSNVTMPEPVAEIRTVGNVAIFDLTSVGKQQGLSVGQKFITTDQAEAYADARVREALVALKDENEMLRESLKNADNEYQQQLLVATILMAKAAGGKLVITESLMAELALHGYSTKLYQVHQSRDPQGNITLTVDKPRKT